MRKYVDRPAEFLVDSGLLFEINRTILHPMGLAIAVTLDESDAGTESAEEAPIKIWDCRDDPEGIYFEDTTFDEGQTKFYKTNKEALTRYTTRRRCLGYVVQGSPKSEG